MTLALGTVPVRNGRALELPEPQETHSARGCTGRYRQSHLHAWALRGTRSAQQVAGTSSLIMTTVSNISSEILRCAADQAWR